MFTILAVEMSHANGSVAIKLPSGTCFEKKIGNGVKADIGLFDAVVGVFKDAGVTPDSIQHLAVSGGPGGFTGLRVASTFSMTFSFLTGVNLIQIPTPLVAAQASGLPCKDIYVASCGKRDTAWYARCTKKHKNWLIDNQKLMQVEDFGFFFKGGTPVVLADQHLPTSHRDYFFDKEINVLSSEYSAIATAELADLILKDDTKLSYNQKINVKYPRKPEAIRLFGDQ